MSSSQKPDSLRENLRPVAEEVCAAVKALSDSLASEAAGAISDTLAADLEKLGEASRRFEETVDAGPEKDDAEWRHRLKNQLNHILGPAQFIAADLKEAGSEHSEIERLLALGERCATLLRDRVKPGNAEDPVKPAPDPGFILVAEDEAENREILGRLLTEQGHEVAFSENGRDALERIRTSEFDAVLLDIRMPEMNGFEVLESLRESGDLRHTPVIVVTGLQEERDAVRCIEMGAEDFLSRPVRPALLAARLNASLEKKRLREQMFAQHFTPKLAREFARNPDPMKMEGRSAEVSVLFCDIRGFSAISERLGPEATIEWLSGVMGEFSGSILDHDGVLVDYTGDEVLAMWGAPTEQPDHAALACRTALEMAGKLPELNAKWKLRIGDETAVGIGISTGKALVGNVGTDRKFKYGPLGTTVNLGSRVQGATKYLGVPILATGETVRHLESDEFSFRRLCRVRVRNIAEPVDLFEIARPGQEGRDALKRDYEAALLQFEAGKLDRAMNLARALLERFPDDEPTRLLKARIGEVRPRTAEAEFDPVWELPGK